MSPAASPATYTSFELHGYSPWSAEEIVRAVDRGVPIAEMPGDFVAVARGTNGPLPCACIVSSTVAALPYYYARHTRGPLFHGPTVFDVVREAKLSWTWNPRAIASLALLEHATGDDSIHESVLRVPPATVITSDGENVTVARQDAWPQMLSRAEAKDTDPHAAVAILSDVFGEMATPEPVVSLTSGFDSRLLLGLSLRAGLRPRALTMGFAHSTDVKVARAITKALGIEHQIVELKPDDYLANARAIVQRTSGAKTANHWHTDLYVRASGLPTSAVHYVGSNGELARSFYFDRGSVARASFTLPSALALPFFAAKIQKRAARLPPALLALGPTPASFAKHVARLVTPMASTFGDALDAFYTTQRVRNLVGMGLALYSAHGRPRSPFLDARWIRAAIHLPREERLGSNYHRRALAAFYPALLAFPVGESNEGPEMKPRAPRLYHARKSANVTYSVYAQVVADPRVQEVIIESRGIDELIPRSQRIAIAQAKSPAMASLLALHFAREIARESV